MNSALTRRRSPRQCGVPDCAAKACYECPRCALPYCSVPCYTGHSTRCVESFAADARRPLAGVTVSDRERRRFNTIVERIREAGFGGGSYEDPVPDDDAVEADAEHVEELPGEENGGEEVGADEIPGLLQQFMDGLDESGKDLIFSMLDAGMEERYRENGGMPASADRLGRSATRKSEQHASASRVAGSSFGAGKGDPVEGDRLQPLPHGDVSDALEQLANDMEHHDLSCEEILARLPKELAHDFERRLRDGRAARLLIVWRPWWIAEGDETGGDSQSGEKLAEEPAEMEEGELPPLPTAQQLLVPLQVPRKNASAFIMHSVVDVLAAYCLSMRLCNGDWRSDAFLVARKLWELSPVLSEDRRYNTIEEACKSCSCKFVQTDKSSDAAMEALSDAGAVLSGLSEWVARALFDCQRILEAAILHASLPSARKHLKARVRKIAYFLSWSLCQDSQSFVRAARAVISYADLELRKNEEVRVASRVVNLARNSAERGHHVTVE